MQSATPNATEPLDLDAEEALHYRALLRRLADMGTDLAADVHAEAKSRPQAATPQHALTMADYAKAFESVARGVRRGILLARKLAEPHPTRQSAAEQRQAARTHIIRAVEDKIYQCVDDDEAPTLKTEFYERLDGPDLDRDLLHRPIAEIVTEICRDLGLEAIPGVNDPWMRRKARDLVMLRARAAGPHPAPPPAHQRPQPTQATIHPRAPPAGFS